MKTFLEAVRSKERAKKLLAYVKKRYGEKDGGISKNALIKVDSKTRDKKYAKQVDKAISKNDDSWDKKTPKVTKIAIKNLHPTQSHVDSSDLEQKLNGNTNRKSISVQKSGNKHFVMDGHHRVYHARLRGKTHIDARVYKEEAPVNNVGGGNIAGAGVGPNGMPGVSKRNQKKHQNKVLRRTLPQALETGLFWGKTTLKVPSSMIHECRVQKIKGKWWTTYLGESEVALAIREWANANPDSPVILEDDIGNICIVRYSKDKY